MKTDKRFTAADEQEALRFLQRAVYGDCIKNAETAIAVAEVLIQKNFGDDILNRQRPLEANLEGDVWMIEGSLNRDKKSVGSGPVIVRLTKSDAKVESFYLSVVPIPGPGGQPVIEPTKK